MPRDHTKLGFRGIGFVTYLSPDSVERVMATKHWLNGQEIAVDRATPKEELPSPGVGPGSSGMSYARPPPNPGGQRRSFDNGASIIGPGLVYANNSSGRALNANAFDNFSQVRETVVLRRPHISDYILAACSQTFSNFPI